MSQHLYKSLSRHAQCEYQKIAPVLLEAARGQIPCDLVIRNCQVVNVLSNELLPGDIWIKSGYIVHVDYGKAAYEIVPLPALTASAEYDAGNRIVAPGYADSHVHIESTMLTPAGLGDLLVAKGTTAIFADPHEIVNVAGKEAFRYMIENSADSPMHQYFLVPSSVPAAPGLENAGADWDAAAIAEMLDLSEDRDNRVAGLAEAMSFLDIMLGEPRQAAILAAARQRLAFIQGHVMGAFGRDLSIYQLAGATTNHECLAYDDIAHMIRSGIRVDIRLISSLMSEDSVAAMVQAVLDCDPDGSMTQTCTDDVHVTDILATGHINRTIAKLVQHGDKPITAIKRASLGVYHAYDIPNAGAIAPRYIADLQILPGSDLYDCIGKDPDVVFVAGEIVVENGVVKKPSANAAIAGREFEAINTVDLKAFGPDDFRIAAPDSPAQQCKVNVMNFEGFLTGLEVMELEVQDGALCWQDAGDLTVAKVYNRYGLDQNGFCLMKGFPLAGGALASTISHDSHNLTVAYKDEQAALKACEALRQCGGGIAFVDSAGELYVHELPVGGLMSAEPVAAVDASLVKISEAFERENPGSNIMFIMVIALPVIPAYRVSDIGLVDVMHQQIIPVLLEE